MATGIELKSAWAFRAKQLGTTNFATRLRTETGLPKYKNWAWPNFWWGTSYSISSYTASVSDQLVAGGITNIAY